jgi:hypothetical protein
MIRKLASTAVVAGALLAPRAADAFLVVGTDAAQKAGPQTHVLVLHESGRSIVSVSPSVRGPAKPLAIVVPLQAASSSSLHAAPVTLFERTEKLAAPRMEELWELDPCELHPDQQSGAPTPSAAAAPPPPPAAGAAVEGDYEISVLGEADSANAAKWLEDKGYKLPDGAADALAALAKPGTVLAVARIEGSRLTFDKDVARLPPLAFSVSGPLSLPLRLAGLGSAGPHDVVIDVLSPRARLEAANLLNLAVPTNLDAREDAKNDADGFYRAVLDYAFEKTPGAAVTEYAWLAASCDGCAAGNEISAEDLLALGADRLPSAENGTQREVIVEVPATLARAPEGPPELKRNIAACYTRALTDMRGLAGEATVIVQTGAAGEVTSAKIKDAGAEALGKCVEEAARSIKFDKPNANDTIKVRFALIARAYLGEMVLARLRARIAKGPVNDVELRAAAPIEGGREEGPAGAAEKKVYFAEHTNNFRARYVVRHPWQGAIACGEPRRDIWGPKPKNLPAAPARPSSSAAASAAPSGSAAASGKAAAASAAEQKLAALLSGGELPDLQAYAIAFRAPAAPQPSPAATPSGTASAALPASAVPVGSTSQAPDGGCGCRVAPRSGGAGSWFAIAAIGALSWLSRRRDRRRMAGNP